MKPTLKRKPAETPLVTAEQIMTKPLVTIATGETMKQAAAIMLDKKISGVAVIDHLDKPIGVLTKTDIARYERAAMSSRMNDRLRSSMRAAGTLELIASGQGFQETEEDYVNHWMTPKVYAVSRTASIASVIQEMGKKRIHRIFVHADNSDELIGVITTFDLLKFMGRVFMVWPEKRRRL